LIFILVSLLHIFLVHQHAEHNSATLLHKICPSVHHTGTESKLKNAIFTVCKPTDSNFSTEAGHTNTPCKSFNWGS